jgi:hypothetical protein
VSTDALFEAADQADRRRALAELLSDQAAIYACAAAMVADWALEELLLAEDEELGWRLAFVYHLAQAEAERALADYQASEQAADLALDQALEAAELAIPPRNLVTWPWEGKWSA